MSPSACALGVALFSHLSTPALMGLLVLGCATSHDELSALGSSRTLTVRQVSCIGLDLEILLLEFPYNLAPPSRYASVGMRLSLTT